jgi:CRISPR/Cas system-associated exonuclease Cas4 (RecB family)
MTPLARNDIQLNQSNLQDFLDCPRRFELKVLEDASWPASLTEPPSQFEQLTDLGDNFHKLSNQFFIGIDPQVIAVTIQDPTLADLWANFLPYAKTLASYQHFTEQILRTSLADYVLVAKYDLIAQLPDHSYLIVDWKTSPKKPDRSQLANRVQTYLYPYILFEGWRDLFPHSQTSPDNLVFQYWYPLAGVPEETFPYSEDRHQETKDKLSGIIADIDKHLHSGAHFPLTDDTRSCQYCNFRSFCERGSAAQPFSPTVDYENEDLSNVQFDIDLIEEIEF